MKRSLSRLQPLRRVAALVLASLLAACSLTPDHVRPAPPVAPAWVDAGSATGTTAADLDWADFLTDERIRALVRLALQNNRDLRIAVLNVEQVRALYGVQRADRLPSVGVGAAAARAANGNGDAYTVGFAVSAFELDLFGRVKALSNAALARYLASDEGRRAAQMTLIAAVANAELTLRADDEQLQVTRSTLASREEVLRLVRVRFEGGVAAEPELRAAESLLAGARATLAALQRQRQQDLNALVLLLGQPLPADLPPAPPLNAFTLAELPVGLPSEVLLQRPDIRAAEQQLMAANVRARPVRSCRACSRTPPGPSPATCCSRCSTPGATRRTWTPHARHTALPWRSTRRRSRSPFAKWPMHWPGAPRWANNWRRSSAERVLLVARQQAVLLNLARLQNEVLLYRVLGGGAGTMAVAAAE